jgi:hypothetical protein
MFHHCSKESNVIKQSWIEIVSQNKPFLLLKELSGILVTAVEKYPGALMSIGRRSWMSQLKQS